MLHYTEAGFLSYHFSLSTPKPDISNEKTRVIKKPPYFSKLIKIVEKQIILDSRKYSYAVL